MSCTERCCAQEQPKSQSLAGPTEGSIVGTSPHKRIAGRKVCSHNLPLLGQEVNVDPRDAKGWQEGFTQEELNAKNRAENDAELAKHAAELTAQLEDAHTVRAMETITALPTRTAKLRKLFDVCDLDGRCASLAPCFFFSALTLPSAGSGNLDEAEFQVIAKTWSDIENEKYTKNNKTVPKDKRVSRGMIRNEFKAMARFAAKEAGEQAEEATVSMSAFVVRPALPPSLYALPHVVTSTLPRPISRQ